MAHKTHRAEKCGICFFVEGKKEPVFTTVRTTDRQFDEKLLRDTYFGDKPRR